MKLSKIVFMLFILLLSSFVWGSSYISRDGEYKGKEYTIKVHWGDIFNMRPRPRHFIRSGIIVASGKSLQRYGNCRITIHGKSYEMKYNQIDFSKIHVRRFGVYCSFKSAINKSMTIINQKFLVKPKPGNSSPFKGPLLVLPIK